MTQNHDENVAVQLTTRDIGFLVRDALEMLDPEGGITAIDASGEGGDGSDVDIDGVDISDPHNPKLRLSNGQVFTIRIIAGER